MTITRLSLFIALAMLAGIAIAGCSHSAADEEKGGGSVQALQYLEDARGAGRAWAIKESLRDLWNYRRKGWARRHWQAWYGWATHSGLRPVVKVARMIKAHLANVLTYCDHRITNATSEGLNSKIQTLKKTLTASAIAST